MLNFGRCIGGRGMVGDMLLFSKICNFFSMRGLVWMLQGWGHVGWHSGWQKSCLAWFSALFISLVGLEW